MLTRRNLLLTGSAFLSAPAIAQGYDADFELILFIDCSSSMYTDSSKVIGRAGATQNYLVQKLGHQTALLNPQIAEVLIMHRVLVRVVLWASGIIEEVFVGIIDSPTAHETLLIALELIPDSQLASGTVHTDCLNYMLNTPRVGRFKRAGDISTDDSLLGHARPQASAARDLIAQDGRDQVNVLSIDHPNNTEHLRNHVQTPNGFTINIDNYQKPITLERFTESLERKLLMELAWLFSDTRFSHSPA